MVELKNKSNPQRPFLTVREMSDWIKIKPKTLYDWVATDRIPYHKIGRKVLFCPIEVLGWLQTLKRGPQVGQKDAWETASENEEVDL